MQYPVKITDVRVLQGPCVLLVLARARGREELRSSGSPAPLVANLVTDSSSRPTQPPTRYIESVYSSTLEYRVNGGVGAFGETGLQVQDGTLLNN